MGLLGRPFVVLVYHIGLKPKVLPLDKNRFVQMHIGNLPGKLAVEGKIIQDPVQHILFLGMRRG
jgi:hypothetical protein